MAFMTPWMKTGAGKPSKTTAKSTLELVQVMGRPTAPLELCAVELQAVCGGAIDTFMYFLNATDGHFLTGESQVGR